MNTALTFNKYCILKTNSERIVNNINLKTTIKQTQSKKKRKINSLSKCETGLLIWYFLINTLLCKLERELWSKEIILGRKTWPTKTKPIVLPSAVQLSCIISYLETNRCNQPNIWWYMFQWPRSRCCLQSEGVTEHHLISPPEF